jgi:hypothetical protein
MLRVNQLAKELGVSNHAVLDVLEKRLGVMGKSHSSNLFDDSIIERIRMVFRESGKASQPTQAQPSGPIRPIVIRRVAAPAACNPQESAQTIQRPQPSEPKPAASQPTNPARPLSLEDLRRKFLPPEAVDAPVPPPRPQEPARYIQPPQPKPAAVQPPPLASVPGSGDLNIQSGFSRIRVVEAPTPPSSPREPARYIQLPPVPAPKPKPETIQPTLRSSDVTGSGSGFTPIKTSDAPVPPPAPIEKARPIKPSQTPAMAVRPPAPSDPNPSDKGERGGDPQSAMAFAVPQENSRSLQPKGGSKDDQSPSDRPVALPCWDACSVSQKTEIDTRLYRIHSLKTKENHVECVRELRVLLELLCNIFVPVGRFQSEKLLSQVEALRRTGIISQTQWAWFDDIRKDGNAKSHPGIDRTIVDLGKKILVIDDFISYWKNDYLRS